MRGRNKKCSPTDFLAEVDAICGGWPDYAEERPLLHQKVHDYLRQKELMPETYIKTVSTHRISMRIADYLEMCAPEKYAPMNRTDTITAINDTLQGRSERTIESLLDEVKRTLGEDKANISAEITADVKDFLRQQLMLNYPYAKSSSKQYKYRIFDQHAERPLKIVTQQIYDWAAKSGFPPDFFRETYFDNVTFYCLPDHADLNFSHFDACTFAVCRIREATFDGTSLYGCEFHSCAVNYATFFQSTLAHTHFWDSRLENVSFQKARLKSCNTTDCTMLNVSFLNATLDGCRYDRVQSFLTSGLHTATITQGGATEKEVEQNRKAIFAALRPESQGQRPLPQKTRGQR